MANGNAGNGGVGTSTYSSWGLATSTGQNVSGTVYFAGGGGGGSYPYNGEGSGGTGGYGGGANGYTGFGGGSNGSSNTGGGAGGAGEGAFTSNGGSGVVIIRYAV